MNQVLLHSNSIIYGFVQLNNTSSSAVADKFGRCAASRFTTNGKILKQSRDHNHPVA